MIDQRAGSSSASDLPCLHIDQNSNRLLRAIWRVFSSSAALSAAALVGFVGNSSSTLAQTLAPAWNQLSPATNPPERYIHAMTYDAEHGQVVLFGGFGQVSPNYLNDTWLWNGTNWTQATPTTSPAARGAHAMAYDAAHGQVVMFGGFNFGTVRFGDTWLWDGTNWTQASPGTSPPARDAAVMVYDAATNNVVLFGGSSPSGDLADTWTWDGTNWTQKNPANSPSARSDYSMVYDPATGNVVLFGGDGNLNDTWIWDGTNWSQQAPANSPPGRLDQGMAYDAALGEVIMWGGENSGGFLNDSWAWNGITWIQLISTATPPAGRYAPNAIAYDAAQNQLLLFSGQNATTVYDDTWTFGLPQNFGNINVCLGGGNSPAPCSATQTLTYNVNGSTYFGTPQVVVQGAAGNDFTLASGSTCDPGAPPTGTCTVNVTFTPQAPGLRTGAVNLVDAGGNLLVSTPIYGNGQGSLISFNTATTTSVGSALNRPDGLAVDAAGNLFIANYAADTVVKVPAGGGTPITVASNLNAPASLAVDGAGNLYVADSSNNRVLEIPAGGGAQTTVGTGLNNPGGVAVDGAGDVFIADSGDNRIVEVTAGGVQLTLPVSGLNYPTRVALDPAGDVFISDHSNNRVVKVPAGCASSGCQTTVGTGLGNTDGTAIDAAGDVFIVDSSNNRIVEVPAGGGPENYPVTQLNNPSYVVVDALGDLFIADTDSSQVLEISPTVPSLNFGSVNVSARSADLGITVQNIGNQTLTGSMGAPTTADFAEDLANSTCTAGSGISLLPGATCVESFYAQPTAPGVLTTTAPVTDNSLTSVQNIGLSVTGVGASGNYTLTVMPTGTGNGAVTDNSNVISCSGFSGTVTGSCSANYQSGASVTLTANAALGSIFQGWGGACASSGSSPTCVLTISSPATSVSATFTQQSFGAVSVCPGGTSVQCSGSTLAVSFNLPANTTVGAVQVVTQGATGLDFALGSGSTCTGTFSTGGSCAVNVKFTPLAPGLRLGAVTLYDNNSNLIATNLISGVGVGPLAAFSPVTQIPVNTGNFSLNYPNGVLSDAAGNLFLANGGNHQVLKISPYGSITQVGSGLSLPQGMAEDGAGNLFIANNSNAIVEIPAGCTSSSCQQFISNSFGFQSELGVAVDAAGNLFVGDYLSGQVEEVPANGGPQTIVYNPTGCGNAPNCSDPVDLTTDAAGNLFIADLGLKTVAEVPVGCTAQSCVKAIGTGWNQPDDVAVDAAGDVFVADRGLSQIIEVPKGCNTAACQIVLVSNVSPVAVSVDAKGNVFYGNTITNQVFEIARSQPPSLNFPVTNVNTPSAPLAVSVQNIGNGTVPLAGSMAAAGFGSNFDASGTCASFSLVPGAACSEAYIFTPQTTGYFTASADFSDNTLNLASSVVLQQVNMTGIGGLNGQAVTAAVPNVVGLTQSAAVSAVTAAGLSPGTISTAASSIVPSGSVIASNPPANTVVNLGSSVNLQISNGQTAAATPNPLSLLNNWFVTGDYASGSVSFSGSQPGATVSGTISIPSSAGPGSAGVPTGADLIDGFLYWATLESAGLPAGANATFLGYSVSGQQIGKDLPNYTIGGQTGTLRFYRADINTWFQNGASSMRIGSGNFAVSLPGSGTSGVLLTQGASLVVIYRVLSPNFPLKAVVIYDGSGLSLSSTTQNMQGFYDAAGGGNASGEFTPIFADSNGWNTSTTIQPIPQPDQFNAPLNAGAAYGAVILSTPVANHDSDGILDSWKTGPAAGDFHAGQPGYYDVKTGVWVGLPGAKSGQKDLFVQLDWMCAALNPDGSCASSGENLFPAPDAQGNDPLAMVKQAFALPPPLGPGIALHLQLGNIVPESTCDDSDPANSGQLCQFPGEPGVVGWKNSLEFSKAWPRNFASCIAGGDCSPRFAYGQKDSYHYVLFGRSLGIPAWNTRYGSLTSINAIAGGTTTIVTTDRGTGTNACPTRITISGIQGMPSLNGVYNTSSCPDDSTIIISTPAAVKTSWSYPNSTLPEPVIGITSGTVTSISGYSDLGGADSAVTLALWETDPSQDMSRKATVIAGTLFHEIGHTLGLTHGGLYYDTPGSYVPNFEANCKPNYQSSMNYLFQLDGVGPASAIAYSNQTLTTLTQSSFGSVTQLLDTGIPGASATFPTSTWYQSTAPDSNTSKAKLHCDGTPLGNDVGYRVSGSISPITPAWTNGQNITFDGVPYSTLRGFNDNANIDLRQVGATGGQYASLASVLSFGSAATPLDIAPGGSVSVEPGGTVTLGAGGSITVPGGSVTIPSNGTISGGGTITLGGGGNVTLGGGGVDTVTPGSNGIIGLPAGGNVTLGGGGTITMGAGGTVTLGGGGNVTLGGGGTITLGGGGSITIPPGGSYTIPSGGGTISFGPSGGNVTLGGGGNVTLGGGGNITLGGGGNITLGGGGNVTLGGGGTITLGGGGNVTLGGGGNVTLGGGGTITLGGGGNVTLGGGGNVTLGGGGTVTLGGGGTITLGGGGNVTLGGGGTVTLGAGGNITLGGGGTVTLGGGGNVTLGGGGTITLGGGGSVTIPPGGSYTIPAGGGSITVGLGGNITLGGGGTITLGGGGNVTLGGGGVVTLGGAGNITLGAGGNITLGGGGNVTLGGGGVTTTELDYDTANSIVRPPTAPTSTTTTAGIVINWTAPGFGVVQTYTISRSVDGGTPVVIGSVSGQNGNPPATTFTDTNPPTGTLVYTITTTLVPDKDTGTQRQSAPSVPAVVTLDQTLVFEPALPSSISITASTIQVTAVAKSLSNGTLQANGQPVSFAVTGACSIASQSVSTATVSLNGAGSCTITASQSGNSTTIPTPSPAYNPATPISGTIMVEPANSNVSSQTINFPPLQNVRYGSSPIPVSATTTSPLQITFTASGPCSMTGATIAITGVGKCAVTASQAGNNTYSAASVMQSFNIAPAVLTVAANNSTIAYGQAIPALTSMPISGFVNGDSPSVVTGVPTLSTTATASSGAGTYPITVSTGSLAAANYDFLFVPGTLTINPAPLTVTANNATKVLDAPNPAFTVTYSGFVLGQNSSVLSGALTCTSTATTISPAGGYPITCSGQTSANYALTYVPGTLTIVYSVGTCDGAPGHQILPPIDPGNSSVFKQGRTVPAQFRVCDANGVSIGTGVVKSFFLTAIDIGTASQTVQTVVDTNNPDTAFRFDQSAQEWIFNISTQSLAAGRTYVYTITLNDGTSIGFRYGLR